MNHHQPQGKTWWGPVWRGLVVDSTAKHYRQMRNACWLFLYLIIHADRRTGQLYRKYSTIAADMGLSVRTVRRWLARLQQQGYISTIPTERAQTISIQKWRALVRAEQGSKEVSGRTQAVRSGGQIRPTGDLSTGKTPQE